MKNPLLTISAEDKALPFDQFKDEHFAPAFQESLGSAKQNLEALAARTDKPTFQNTVEALETFKEDLDQVSTVFFNYTSAHTNDKLQALAKEISPVLASLANDVYLNENIFKRLESVYKERDTLKLGLEENELLSKSYRSFRRNGALLDGAAKEKLRAIDKEMASLSHEFSDHLLKDTNDYEYIVKDRAELQGLPEGEIETAFETAKERGHPGTWVFTCQFPSYIAIMKYADKADLREILFRAMGSRCMNGPTDNRELLKRIANLRHERATLLGYKNYAELILEERMASSSKEVLDFLNGILTASKPAGIRDVEELRALKEKLGHGKEIFPWDIAYYSEKLKMERFNFNEEELRPYFKLENVIKGVFLHAEKLYGLHFENAPELPVYHPDVHAYKVSEKDSGKFIGFFYGDFFVRSSKRSGAWMTSFREQGLWKGKVLCPHISIVCNFAKPTATRPSLLTLNDTSTLFHEFGHALHGLLSQVKYVSLGGTNVYWDFVELPSQLMENWVMEEEGLKLFATHFETGKIIPQDFIQKIKKSRQFQAGYQSVRQVSLGLLDMAWHNGDTSHVQDVESYEREATKATQILKPIPGATTSAAFSHIFSGGYAAGYYSYKWAEVLDADAFEYFQEHGIFNRDIGKKFRDNILSRGSSEHPMTLYKRFRGRAPDPNALLRRDGLL